MRYFIILFSSFSFSDEKNLELESVWGSIDWVTIFQIAEIFQTIHIILKEK